MRMSSVELPDDNDKSSASTSPCPSPVRDSRTAAQQKSHRLLPTNLYVVLFNFKARHQDELDLKAGYKVTVIDTTDMDWWKGKCLGRIGFFPSKYVTKIQPGERPLQVTHNLQVADDEGGLSLLRDQIVIQVGEELDGMVMIRSGDNRQGVCPLKFLQEAIIVSNPDGTVFRAPPPNPSPASASASAPAPAPVPTPAPAPPLPAPNLNECWSPVPAPACPAPSRFTFIPCVTTLDWTPPRRVIPPPLSLPLSPPSPTPADALNNNLPSPTATTPGSSTATNTNASNNNNINNNYCSPAPATSPTSSSASFRPAAAPAPPRKTSKRGGLRSLLSPTSSAPPRLGVTRSVEVNADVRGNGLAFNDNFLWGDNNNGEESEYVLTVHGWKPRGQTQGAVVLSPGEYPARRSHRPSDANEDSLARPLLTRTRSGSAASTEPPLLPPPASAGAQQAASAAATTTGPAPAPQQRLGHRRLNSTSSSRTESDISSASGFHQRLATGAGAGTPPTPRPALRPVRPAAAAPPAPPPYSSMARPLGIPPLPLSMSAGSMAFSQSWRLLGGGGGGGDSPVSPAAGLLRGCWDCTSQARPLLILVNRGRVGQPGPNEYQCYPYPS
ncbi:SH3 and cysteine-rich domain-containing protein 3 [Frankliniella fusca]|uniref:SH3 and cysteine-rich domain-containing protein 3 n=1 Tax=Frankliniella fusca TaxID=407009 RepID=A0AAE1H6P6_9NEOP|nr:SH3 and cysteine-rich domain-containing protein 3 [Frankliniella fusca]